MKRSDWKFSDYVEEMVCIAEILEIPGFREKLRLIVAEALEKFPDECEEMGIA
jgi:hypothetical protein